MSCKPYMAIILLKRLRGFSMSNKKTAYGLELVERPKVKANKRLDLSGEHGKQIIKSETKLALKTHSRTFKRLADM